MHTRAHYSDYTVIASHMFKQKRDNVEKTGTQESERRWLRAR